MFYYNKSHFLIKWRKSLSTRWDKQSETFAQIYHNTSRHSQSNNVFTQNIQYKPCFLLRWFDGQNVQKTRSSVQDARTKRPSRKHLMSTKMATSSSYSMYKLSSHWSSTTRTSTHNLWNSRSKSQLDFNWQKLVRHLHHIYRA